MSNRPNTSHRQPVPASGGGRATIWAIVLGVIVLAGIAAIAVTALTSSDDDSGTATGPGTTSDSGETGGTTGGTSGGEMPDPRELAGATVSGTALSAFEDTAGDPAVGKPAPVLEGVDLYGEPMTIGGAGEPTVVVFLAHWCPHCQREVPVLVDWFEENGQPEGVEVVGLTTAFDETRGNWSPGEWLAEEGWAQPTMVDPDGGAAETWGLTSFPYFVAIDANGDVVARAAGELTTAQFEELLEAARSGTPVA